MSNSSALSAHKLCKAYRGRKVVKGISLTINAGEAVGLLGPNGAGKTTTFYMICGLVKADSGSVILDGQDITRLAMHERARLGLGYLPQEVSVFRKLSVADNIMAVLEHRPELNNAERLELLEHLLDELGITHIRDSDGIALSGGEKRRVEIARALAAEPRFILLDEPFAGVDPISVKEIQKIVEHLRDRGIGVLITDHHVRETLGVCDRAYIVGAGELIAEGSPDEVLADKKVQEVYLGDNFH